ncbi:citrate transporter-domain-containing protein [Paraphysoderma sedebokerense]|nr:citrate transporter-domain-containing protein [Paraphysoderma sedebokerense]
MDSQPLEPLTFKSWLSLATFILTIIPIFRPTSIRIQKIRIHFNFSTAPIIGVIFLLITTCIGVNELSSGIIGDPKSLQPWAILVLFMCMAYLCISLDATGIFEYIAWKAAWSAGNSARKLFFYFFLLSSILTLFTSNDIVILTLTPIIISTAKYIKVDPFPFLFIQFFAANTWSSALYVGNPTNIIIASAYNFNVLEFSKYLALPTVGTGLTVYILTFLFFRRDLPPSIVPPSVELNSKNVLKDKSYAIFGSVWLLLCLITLFATSFINVPIWIITLAFSVVTMARDLIHDKKRRSNAGNIDSIGLATLESGEVEQLSVLSIQDEEGIEVAQKKDKKSNPITNYFSRNFPTFHTVMYRLPWSVVPFVLGMFTIVEALSSNHLLPRLSYILAKASISVPISIFLITFISCLLCTILNNQPASILLTKTLLSPMFASLPPAITKGAMLSAIAGCNLGACFSLTGALAGFLWVEILKSKNVEMSMWRFCKVGLIVMPVATAVGCFILWVEIAAWG